MKDGTCPKCGSDDVRTRAPTPNNGAGSLMITTWTSIYLQTYVCLACGYLESYVPEHKRSKIAEKWTRVKQRIFEGH